MKIKNKYILILLLTILLFSCNKKETLNEEVIIDIVPSLPEEYPDYYAKCNKCGHIWKTQTEEMCKCNNFDNVEYYEFWFIKKSRLYKSLDKNELLSAECDEDSMTITITFRNGTTKNEKYNDIEEFRNDEYILFEHCGQAEYIYRGLREAEIDLGNGSAVLDETKEYPHKDIIYFPRDYDVVFSGDSEIEIITKDNFSIILPANS